ncbi:MAG TPA: Asp-tRNA(Asn)/Glu-tRNA(Gln) amidotransferase subunit GatA [Bacteroidota bacterium]|nr:Asp-tRNA(Asn)/Glu-tRNA(Gln) amidotransferase subunit GatA [Bacteroidota bacterium]
MSREAARLNLLEPFDSYRRRLSPGGESCEDRVGEYLSSIAAKNHLNAFLTVLKEEALADSRAVDKKIAAGTAGPLAGMVVAVKDVLSMKGTRTTCGSKILGKFEAIYDATVIERLKAADAIIIGKTNMDEFAMGSSTENSAYGPVKNPIDETRVPGGSSGGSAVAVAAGMAATALGSDTGGSIRQPAGLCGVFGLKPTYGRVSRYGLVAFASSFDQIGPFANSARDIAHLLGTIAGYDERDSTSANIPVPDYLSGMDRDLHGLKIGLPREYFNEALPADIRDPLERRIAQLKDAGVRFIEVGLPHAEYTIAAYYVLATAEASSNLARYDGARYGYRSEKANDLVEMYTKSRSEGFGAEVKRRIMLGTYVLSAGYYDAYYRKAQRVRRLIQKDFLDAFQNVDCLVTPISPTTAFRFGEKMDDPLQMYLSDIYTVSANLAGIPGISVPAGVDRQGLPVGIQILGKHFDEMTLLKVADFLEAKG